LVYLLLKDGPDQAPWLSTKKKAVVKNAFRHDIEDVAGNADGTFLQLLQDPKAYLLGLVNFFVQGATYTMVLWVPTLIQSWGVEDLFLIGLCASIPNAAGIIGMILIGRHSNKWHKRRWRFAVFVVIAAAGLFTTTLFQENLAGSILALALAVIAIASATLLFFALTSEYLSVGAAPVGLALISSLGQRPTGGLGRALSGTLCTNICE